MASEEEQKKGEGKGFAGLSSMVSDVDATVASTPKQTHRASSDSSSQQSAQTSRPAHQEQPRPTPQAYQSPSQPSGGSSTGKWLFGIAAVIGVIWLANQSDNNTSSRPAYSPGTSSTSVAPAPAWQPPAAQPQAPSRPTEDKPSVGRNNVLSTAQIRYCLAEKIRLDAAETVINNYVDSDVDRFNGYVNDYNSRCGEFRYRQGALESARRDVEPFRSQLQAEGRSRFVRSPAAATRSSTPAQVPQPVRPSPDATVQAVQRRLNELGYDAGPADGLFGAKTRAAIQAFQRDGDLLVDGVPSTSLLEKLSRSAAQARNSTAIRRNETSTARSSGNRSLPENAVVDVYGTGWVCKRGYYKSGNECLAVQLPQNATLDVYGSGWVCQRGYYKSGNGCLAVQMPRNATLDVYGSGWVCQRGYYKSGNECLAVQLPQNATIDVYGSGWVCQRGYYKSGNECLAVQMPRNATLDVYGSGWVCQRGYYKSGNECLAVQLPQNATLDVYGSGWVCQRGYTRVGDKCEAI